jgi:hypothetical protein
MIPDCTLVTACYDLTKFNSGSRNIDKILENMKCLLEVPCYLVIFTDNILYPHISELRNKLGFENITKYIIREFEDLKISMYTDLVNKNREIYHPTKDHRTSAHTHLLCCSKFDFVLEIIDTNPFNTSKFGWIDSNLEAAPDSPRYSDKFSKISCNYTNNLILRAMNNCTDKFHIQIMNVNDKKYKKDEHLKEYYETYRWVVCGCFFLTGKEIGKKILNRLNEIFIHTTIQGYGHGEEMLYITVLDEYYNDIIKSYGDYYHILNNFVNTTTAFSYIYHQCIKKYLDHGYHRECIDCCLKVLYDIENFNVEIDYEIYFYILFTLYVAYFYYDHPKSIQTCYKILKLINENFYIKKVYEGNKEYFDDQFKYVLD